MSGQRFTIFTPTGEVVCVPEAKLLDAQRELAKERQAHADGLEAWAVNSRASGAKIEELERQLAACRAAIASHVGQPDTAP